MTSARSIDPRTRIGHVHLKVADLERALGFYRDLFGSRSRSRIGAETVFLSAGGYHHHIGLNTWESRSGSAPPAGRWVSTKAASASAAHLRKRARMSPGLLAVPSGAARPGRGSDR